MQTTYEMLLKTLKVAFHRIENIVRKEENAAFSSFPTMFSKGFFLQCVKSSSSCGKGLTFSAIFLFSMLNWLPASSRFPTLLFMLITSSVSRSGNADNQHFLLYPIMTSILVTSPSYFREASQSVLILYHTITTFTDPV